MYINIDETYNFVFKPDFNTLNNVYKVTQQLSYDEILATEINMVDSLYSRVNKTEEDWIADADGYRSNNFYKLEAMNIELEPDSFYIPEDILLVYPDPNIHKYGKISLMVDLGVFANEAELSTMLTDISNILETNHGITTPPKTAIYDDTWMSEDDYNVVVATRDAAKGTILNYLSESQRLELELTNARNKIIALEAIIISP